MNYVKCLGVIIDESLSWGPHVEYVKKTVSSNLGMLNRIRKYVPQSSLHSLFVCLVTPCLDYCCTVWGGRYIYHDDMLKKLSEKSCSDNLAVCLLNTISRYMFSKLNWLTFSERVKYRKAVLVFKCVNRMSPLYMTHLFTPLTHIRETRQSTSMALTIPFAQKNCYASSFAVSGAVIWNDLPPQLLAITCLKSFKRELHKTLCSHYHASLQACMILYMQCFNMRHVRAI